MGSINFTSREKGLLVVLVVLLCLLAWYLFVYQGTADELTRLDNQIVELETQTDAANVQLAQMESMRKQIDEKKSSGVKQTTLPDYDNIQPLMNQLYTILANTVDYELAFDDLDTSTEGLVKRGVTITFGCQSLEEGRNVMTALEQGLYPCSIDSASMQSTTDRTSRSQIVGTNTGKTSAPFAVGLHAIFSERV